MDSSKEKGVKTGGPNQPSQIHEDCIKSYLSQSGLPSLSSITSSYLDTPITDLELAQDIKNASSRKAPGPDGFTLSYYKQFLPVLSPHFIKAFHSFSQPSSICPT